MAIDSTPWTRQASLVGLPDKARLKDLLDVAWGARMFEAESHATRTELARNFWADASQCVSRSPWGLGVRCLAQNSIMYCYEKDTVLSGFDHLRLQGAPTDAAPPASGPDPPASYTHVSDAQLRCLAGEAFTCPIVTCVVYAFWLNPWGVWWAPAGGSDSHST